MKQHKPEYKYSLKIYVKNKLRHIAFANIVDNYELQDVYNRLKNDSPILNFGDIWIMKSEIRYVKIKEY